jgi:acyl-CoA synthetase (AMP-forming)/AMP-acid ligase II
MKTLADLLERSERLFPGVDALVYQGARTSYRVLVERGRRLANALAGLGVRRQDRVGMMAMNCREYFDVFSACHLAGFIASTVNYRLTAPEVIFIVNDAEPSVLIFEDQYADLIASIRHDLRSVKTFVCIGDCPEWCLPYDALCASGSAEPTATRPTPDDIAHLIYTSGTTGRPKGVVRTHRAAVSMAQSQALMLELKINGRILIMMPMFHVGAISMFLPQQLQSGTVILHRSFDAGEALRDIERERVVTTHMAPTMVRMMLEHPELGRHDLSTLETLCYSAASMPVELLKQALEVFGPVFLNSWGATEGIGTGLAKHFHKLDGDSVELRRLGSIGQPQPGSEIRLIDDNGEDCPTGKPGEILLRSGNLMSGYWNNSAATIESLRDGWYHSGDIAYADEEGFLYLVDRKKDMIVSGGENIYSQEVEQALMQHRGVADCAVIGVPDEKWGEAVKAIVVPAPGHELSAEALIDHCAAFIARYKRPKSVAFVDVLPRLPSGKINKLDLRSRFRA